MSEDGVNSARGAADIAVGTEVLRFVRAQLWWIVGFFLLGGTVGYAISYGVPREWEASLVLQIGEDEDAGVPVSVDPPARAVERIGVKSFKDQVLKTLSLPVEGPGDQRVRLIRKTLQAEMVPNTDLIKISVRDFSPANAEAILRIVQNQLTSSTEGVVAEALKRLQNRLSEVDTQIANVQAKMSAQRSSASAPQAEPGGQGAVNQLLHNMLDVSSANMLAEAERQRADIVREMSPDHTYNTKPLGAVAVSAAPVAPKRGTFAVLGALLGLWIGLMSGGLRWKWR